jgi:SAM-dependent methyltransferase
MGARDALRRIGWFGSERWFFTLAYLRRRTPWDTNITPPELVRVVEGAGPEHRAPGRALDLGCGTGTNAVYLARHGWEVTGVDYAAPAIARARARARRAGLPAGSARFLRGDVTRLDALGVRGPHDLIFDLGCFHSLAPEGRARYAAQAARLAAPGALLLVYALAPTQLGGRAVGLTADEMARQFAADWAMDRVEPGTNPNGHPSAWYWLRHHGP